MGRTSTFEKIRAREETAAAAESVTMISGLGKAMRSPAAMWEKGPASMRLDHSRMAAMTIRARPASPTGQLSGDHRRSVPVGLGNLPRERVGPEIA
jgi:hypothetical protein